MATFRAWFAIADRAGIENSFSPFSFAAGNIVGALSVGPLRARRCARPSPAKARQGAGDGAAAGPERYQESNGRPGSPSDGSCRRSQYMPSPFDGT